MDEMEPGSIAVLPGARMRTRNRDVEYLFRQDSDFYYLTGFVEADAWLVLAPGREHGETILFCAERDAQFEQWNGELIGAGPCLAVSRRRRRLFPSATSATSCRACWKAANAFTRRSAITPSSTPSCWAWVKDIRARESGGARPPGEFVALKHLLHEQRLYKSAAEIALMPRKRLASRRVPTCAPCAPLRRASRKASSKPSSLTSSCVNGARSPAYPCIVGSGPNACVLHYIDNDRTLRQGELVLIDAGCEYAHYAADVTRTFPVSGRFSAAQQTLYEIVLEANEQAIAACRPGNTFNDPHEVSLRVMVQGLVDLGLLKGSVDGLLESGDYRRFCPHKASHWLGLDVHDVGDYRIDDTWRELEPGMVMTIEPGIYVPAQGCRWRRLALDRHRHTHRRRCAGDTGWPRGADRAGAESGCRRRARDVAWLMHRYSARTCWWSAPGSSVRLSVCCWRAGVWRWRWSKRAEPRAAATDWSAPLSTLPIRHVALSPSSRSWLEQVDAWPGDAAGLHRHAGVGRTRHRVPFVCHTNEWRRGACGSGLGAGITTGWRRRLWQRVLAEPRITPYVGAQVTALDGDSVRMARAGSEQVLAPRLLLAADGARSTLRELLGVKIDTFPTGHHALANPGAHAAAPRRGRAPAFSGNGSACAAAEPAGRRGFHRLVRAAAARRRAVRDDRRGVLPGTGDRQRRCSRRRALRRCSCQLPHRPAVGAAVCATSGALCFWVTRHARCTRSRVRG